MSNFNNYHVDSELYLQALFCSGWKRVNSYSGREPNSCVLIETIRWKDVYKVLVKISLDIVSTNNNFLESIASSTNT